MEGNQPVHPMQYLVDEVSRKIIEVAECLQLIQDMQATIKEKDEIIQSMVGASQGPIPEPGAPDDEG